MQFESKLQDIKDLKKRNKAFGALSNEDKRKEIAWDCFQLTLIGKVSGSFGKYWSSNIDYINEPNPIEFQKRLVENLPECQVCARGGMMLSQIRLGNKLSSDTCDVTCGTDNNDDVSKKIMKGFTPTMFKYMELVYEGELENYYSSYSKYPYQHNTTQMLQNICLQVVVSGKFKVSDYTDYLSIYLKPTQK